MIGCPTPWVRRYPRISESWVVHPGAVHEWVPCRPCEIRPPARSEPTDIREAPVVGKVAPSIRVWRLIRIGNRTPLVVLGLVLIPLIVRVRNDFFGQLILVSAEVKRGGSVLRHLDRPFRSIDLNLAIKYRDLAASILDIDPEVR